MASRDEIKSDLSELIRDKEKLDRLFANADKQAEIAKNLNLTSKENEEVEVEEKDMGALYEEVAKALKPVLDKVKELEAKIVALEAGVVKQIGDSPKTSLEDAVIKYLNGGESTTTTVSRAQKPDVAQFKTPQIAKTFDDGDLFGAINAGAFDKPRQQ